MKTSKAQFTILPSGHGQYKVTYQDKRGTHSKVINDMTLIDDVKHIDYPTQAALNRLKRSIKA